MPNRAAHLIRKALEQREAVHANSSRQRMVEATATLRRRVMLMLVGIANAQELRDGSAFVRVVQTDAVFAAGLNLRLPKAVDDVLEGHYLAAAEQRYAVAKVQPW